MNMLYSINQLISERVRDYPDFEILGIPDREFTYTKYTYSDLDIPASLLAHYFVDNGILPPRKKGDSTTRMTVGLLGQSGIEYVITELALLRLGYCVLFVSPNNSPPAIAHLLKTTESSHLLVKPSLLPSATACIPHLPPSSTSIISQPSPTVYSPAARAASPGKTRWDPILEWESEYDMPAIIIHSSGSTGFPKPIVITNKAALGNWKGNFGMCSLTTLPLYHSHGHSNMFRAFYSLKPIYLFPTGSIPLTSTSVLTLLRQAPDVEAFFGVPFVLKLLAESEEGLRVLSRLKLVMFGGSSCPDELGDQLVASGVPLVGHYGSTETGQLMTSFRDFEHDKEWNYVRASGPGIKVPVKDYLKFEPVAEGTYELVVLDGWHTKVMSNRPDGSYATKDLFIKHPTIPDAYKFIGRIDDTLVMVNGEKTNPVPLELTLRASPYISDAIIFGSARTQIGALILPSSLGATLPAPDLTRAIAPAIAQANAEAPSHSQLAMEAVVVLPFGTAIPRADKGSVVRPKVYREFESVIDDVYKRLEGEGGGGARVMLGEDEGEEARRIVREMIGKTIERPIDNLTDDTDLFEFGLDSLQTSRIRNVLQREVDLGGKKLSSNVVFEHPSISKLAHHLLALSSGQATILESNNSREIMLNLVEKYRYLKSPSASANGIANGVLSDRVIVLTGVTGSLGAYLLDELLADTSIKYVYCLCRAKNDEDAAARVRASMKTRMLEARFIENTDRVVILASDLSAEKLGLADNTYEELATRVTCIIHNAWAVNFNLGISSFEGNIRGAVNLMNLALATPHGHPKSFYFASSVSAVALWPGPDPVPEMVMEDTAVAQGIGYAQSKWVTEKLCQIAAQSTPLRTGILRIGQMVGDTRNGIWNETEAISLIIKCADTLGLLPNSDESLSWLPVDYAARSIVELTNIPLPDSETPVWHILHPHLTTWQAVHASLRRAGLAFKSVHRKDWVKALKASSTDEVVNPSRKLLVFYEGKYGMDEVPMRYPLSMKKTLDASEVLSATPAVDSVLVGKWVDAWRKSGFLR